MLRQQKQLRRQAAAAVTMRQAVLLRLLRRRGQVQTAQSISQAVRQVRRVRATSKRQAAAHLEAHMVMGVHLGAILAQIVGKPRVAHLSALRLLGCQLLDMRLAALVSAAQVR